MARTRRRGSRRRRGARVATDKATPDEGVTSGCAAAPGRRRATSRFASAAVGERHRPLERDHRRRGPGRRLRVRGARGDQGRSSSPRCSPSSSEGRSCRSSTGWPGTTSSAGSRPSWWSIFLILLAVAIGLIVVYGLVKQWPDDRGQPPDGLGLDIQKSLKLDERVQGADRLGQGQPPDARQERGRAARPAPSATSIGGIASLIFGIFISLNILVWVLIQGRKLGGGRPSTCLRCRQPVAYDIFANSARFFRGYIYGSTHRGPVQRRRDLRRRAHHRRAAGRPPSASSAGSPTTSRTSAPSSAARSPCSIAWGAGGPSMAIPMLIIVIIANGFLQTLVSQFALGSALNLHPLAVLFATTAGGIAVRRRGRRLRGAVPQDRPRRPR